MSRVRYLPAALQALDDIFRYTQETWGEEQADKYVGSLFDACEALPPHAPRVIPFEFHVEGFVTRCQHHRIYWRQSATDEIIVVCILHERMHQAARLLELSDEEE
jgi:plasmid stabilization system protein ParE